MNYLQKQTSTRNGDKKNSNIQNSQVQTPALQNQSTNSSKRIPDQQQVQKISGPPQEIDKQSIQQLIAQEVKEKVLDELLSKFQKLENQLNELTNDNLQIKQKIGQQEQKIQYQEQKLQQQEEQIQQQGEQIQQQEQKIGSLNQNQPKLEIQEKLENFIQNNNKAHEIWRMSSEKIEKTYGIIEKQFQDLEIFKKQIADKLNENTINLAQSVKDELQNFQEQINKAQFQTNQNLHNINQYEEILKKSCQDIYNCLGLQGNQMLNFNDNNFKNSQSYPQQFDPSQYPQQFDPPQYPQQFDPSQYPQQFDSQYTQPQEQQYQQQSSVIYTTPQYQQSSQIGTTSQNDPNSSFSQISANQNSGKSKIRLISSSQNPQAQG